MPKQPLSITASTIVALFAAAVLLLAATHANAQETVLYSFDSTSGDGYSPFSGLIFDSTGNLYGTTYKGGVNSAGTAFELSPAAGGGWTEKVLHSFGAVGDGVRPHARLVIDSSGKLYGTTVRGGLNDAGSVFELSPNSDGSWTETLIHSFQNDGTDGFQPQGSLILDAAGNLYGTTYAGGRGHYGTVFELTPDSDGSWTETILHSFINDNVDGVNPEAELVFDGAGNLYGTTTLGGVGTCSSSNKAVGCGTVFELSPRSGGHWAERVLHSFISNTTTDGYIPEGGLVIDQAGNLYGTAVVGGLYSQGITFQLKPAGPGVWSELVLYNFGQKGDGAVPVSNLVLDSVGNVYGVTSSGGTGKGTVYELTPTVSGTWTETALWNFCAAGGTCPDGKGPEGSLIFDGSGNLYGTTYLGGSLGAGSVFELTP